MAEYYNPGGYPPPPAHTQNTYPLPPRPQQYEGQPQGNSGYSSPAPQSTYGYQPAREDQYQHSPRSSGMQVGQYGAPDYEYGRERRNSGPYAASQYRGSEASYYAPPPHEHSDRPSSRGSRRGREKSRDRGEKHGHHEAEKAVGATVLGGALAGWAGHELGHSNSLVTVASTLVGAYAGHKLESKHEKDKVKKREHEHKEGESVDYSEYRAGGAGADGIITTIERHSRAR
ncbi:hypothetical protein EDD37DRAFT_650564 [Exophiala viscosa]|uniref:uncharacterized protein n=1 Tax=Exophiala viscosa TaxID=2486360 RepID=UPI00218FDF39|nr:hypothetical protein EDD37DRAFT_650564 [Exophiala viscosa]